MNVSPCVQNCSVKTQSIFYNRVLDISDNVLNTVVKVKSKMVVQTGWL